MTTELRRHQYCHQHLTSKILQVTMKKAFTLIELLVVIAIIGVLVGLLLTSGPAGTRGSSQA